ncbi:MAG TPA: hypothetical protein EYH07_20080 [Kiloniellaceae bacterium]|nr:hypothetical protein [Kiloniellaceae bacterium]
MTAETEIRAQLDRWFAGWSPGQTPFDAEGMRPLFAEGEIRVIDDFGDRVSPSTASTAMSPPGTR